MENESIVDKMRPYSDFFNYPEQVSLLYEEEMEKCQIFEYWLKNYYTTAKQIKVHGEQI